MSLQVKRIILKTPTTIGAIGQYSALSECRTQAGISAGHASSASSSANSASASSQYAHNERLLAEEARDDAESAAAAGIASHTGRTDNPHGVTKSQVGLGSVTDDAQVKRSEMGAASGVATLDASTRIPGDQLPYFLGSLSGSVSREISGKLGDVVSVKDFGATGDGATDDTAAVLAAITAAVAANKRLYIPHGTYLLSQQGTATIRGFTSRGYCVRVTGADGLRIYGDGTFTTAWTGSTTSPPNLFYFSECKNCTVDGLRFTGPASHSVTPDLMTGAAVIFDAGYSNLVQNCWVENCADGFVLNEEHNSCILRCVSSIRYAAKSRHHIICYGGETCVIEGCSSHGAATDGNIFLYGAGYTNSIRNCYTSASDIDDQTYAPNALAQGFGVDSGQIQGEVTGCTVRGCYYGIDFKSNLAGVRITNNRVVGCLFGIAYRGGESVARSTNLTITGNTVLMNGALPLVTATGGGWPTPLLKGAGILLQYWMSGVSIETNHIADDYRYWFGIKGDGVTTAFVTKYTSLTVNPIKKNSVNLTNGVDYSVSGGTITFTVAPLSTDRIEVQVAAGVLDWCGIGASLNNDGAPSGPYSLNLAASDNRIEMAQDYAGFAQYSAGHAIYIPGDPDGAFMMTVDVHGNSLRGGYRGSTGYTHNGALCYISQATKVSIENNSVDDATYGYAFRIVDGLSISFGANDIAAWAGALYASRTNATGSVANIWKNHIFSLLNGVSAFKTTNIRTVSLEGTQYPIGAASDGYILEADNTAAPDGTGLNLLISMNACNPVAKGSGAWYRGNGVNNATTGSPASVTAHVANNIIY